ncbi:MAG TPA: Rrf2 family transcriptional regulator [Holophagaceae bacterium]|nr:Rrf2 family transcriptional regulator [Holophagaceae bacterium]
MIFSSASAYALRALAALPEDGSFVMAKDLAEQLGLPGPYLAKVLQGLVQGGMLESVRGPKGGFRLARETRKITVEEVVHLLDGEDTFKACVMGFPECSSEQPCPMHDAWTAVKEQMASSMTNATIEDLKQVTRARGFAVNPGVAGLKGPKSL